MEAKLWWNCVYQKLTVNNYRNRTGKLLSFGVSLETFPISLVDTGEACLSTWVG